MGDAVLRIEDTLMLNRLPLCFSIEVSVPDDEVFSASTFEPRSTRSAEKSNFPNLINLHLSDSDTESKGPSVKNSSRRGSNRALGKKFSLRGSNASDRDSSASCASEITELSSGQFENDRDMKNKSCCLCLLM
jgi:hypothetical protein